jgi:hypothetical protein
MKKNTFVISMSDIKSNFNAFYGFHHIKSWAQDF